MKPFFFFFFLFFLILTTSVLAIGISPPKLHIDYEEGKVVPLTLYIVNSGGSKDVALYQQGWLADYVTLSEEEFTFSDERFYEISANFTMPPYDTITEYGPQRLYIGAKDIVKAEGTVSATAAVRMWVSVDIPFPGKYARIHSLTAENINEGENATTTFMVRNRGTNALANSKVKLSLANFDGDIIAEKEFDNVFIDVEKNKTFEHVFVTDEYDSGIYTITGTFVYDDGKFIDRETTFFIGSTDVILVDHTPYLEQGRINKINLTLQSIWGSPLENIRLSITAEGQTTDMPLLDLGPFEKRTVQGFIEPSILEDTEELNATLHIKIPVDDGVVFEKDTVMTFRLLVPAEKESPFSLNATTFLAGVAIVLVLALVANIVLLTKKKSTSKKKPIKKSTKKK